jgi:hypothetical protein
MHDSDAGGERHRLDLTGLAVEERLDLQQRGDALDRSVLLDLRRPRPSMPNVMFWRAVIVG